MQKKKKKEEEKKKKKKKKREFKSKPQDKISCQPLDI